MGDLSELATLASKHMETWLFYLVALITVPFAFGVLLDRNIIRAGFLLIGVFGGISALFLLLQAQFLAMAQLMIYAVGITLVVVIALMLTNPRMEEDKSPSIPAQKAPAALVGTLLFIALYMAILSEGWGNNSEALSPDNITIIGYSLLTHYALPFEFASILLLIALVGAVMLAKHDHFNSKADIDEIEEETKEISERNEHVVKV
ncbi:MAG: NADH-quinone oxidoreductase subunit J [Candidatus Obscuribacterales bacterium]|nr:NADH-quinone oxidoreductase subunit J [Candidatus Obscuribacterales bacterium]